MTRALTSNARPHALTATHARCVNARATRSRSIARASNANANDVKMITQGIHLEITTAIDGYCKEKLGRACSHVDAREIREVDVRCSARGGEDSKGGHEHRTEVTVLMTRGTTIHADEAGENLYATIDACADKVARAMRKHKEKHSAKGERHAAHAGSAKDAIYKEATAGDDEDDVPAAA